MKASDPRLCPGTGRMGINPVHDKKFPAYMKWFVTVTCPVCGRSGLHQNKRRGLARHAHTVKK